MLSYYFIIVLNTGISGIGYAGTLTNVIIYSISLVYTQQIKDIKAAIFMPGREVFYGLSKYVNLGIHSALMLCMEWWAFEAMMLISGYINVQSQAAHIIIMQTIEIVDNFRLGLIYSG